MRFDGLRRVWGNASKGGKVTIVVLGVLAFLVTLGAIIGEEDNRHGQGRARPQASQSISHPSQATSTSTKHEMPRQSRPSRSKDRPKQRQVEPSPAVRRFQIEERAQVEIEQAVTETEDSAEVNCAPTGTGGVTCGVTYEINELVGIDTDEELLNAQRDVWETLFANPRFKEGFIELEAPVETVGGKESIAPVLRVRCDRAAAREIAWDNVRPDGMKQLCQWDQLVG